jgi:hypothetical protein
MSCQNCQSNYPKVVSIDRAKLEKGDIHHVTLLAFAANPPEFERRLAMLGLSMEDYLEDVEFLAELHKMGGDVNGLLKDDNGNKIVFNAMEFARNIPLDTSMYNPVKIKLV